MQPPSCSREGMYYNALALASRLSYAQLLTAYQHAGAVWETAWHQHTQSLFPISPEQEMERLTATGVGLVLREETGYPALLRELSSPPFGLYWRGTLPSLSPPTLAIVGTRRATSEGRSIAEIFAERLVERGWVVVSGLAFGIDAASHTGALRGQGTTVAVLAHGLHMVHPETNARLADEILAHGGTLVSEYPLGMPALKQHFVARNRIISGLAKGVLIIEAPLRSGALRTADFAVEQNREVLVVPGPISHPNFEGSHELIRKGATLVTSPNHVFEHFGFDLTLATTRARSQTDHDVEIAAILRALQTSSRALTIDKISEVTNLNVQSVLRGVTILTLQGVVHETLQGISLRPQL